MWVKVKKISSATWKTILMIVFIGIYAFISDAIPTWIGGDIPFVKFWLFGAWNPINNVDAIVYTLSIVIIISFWIGGAVMSFIGIVIGFIVYFWILSPLGTMGIQGEFNGSYVSISFQILPIFLIYLAALIFSMVFDILAGIEAYKHPCLSPVYVDGLKLNQQQKQKIADYNDIQAIKQSKIEQNKVPTSIIKSTSPKVEVPKVAIKKR